MRSHDYYMQLALSEAKKAYQEDEVPIGCVIVDAKGQILAKARNSKEKKMQATAHAEIRAIEKASKKLKSWRLPDTTLYVTLEPCLMCASAISQARIKTVVFATPDPKGGAYVSVLNINETPKINHKVAISAGTGQIEACLLLTQFFKAKRKKNK